MSVDTQFIITCSTLRITLYLSEANQVYSLSRLTIAWSILSAHFEPAKSWLPLSLVNTTVHQCFKYRKYSDLRWSSISGDKCVTQSLSAGMRRETRCAMVINIVDRDTMWWVWWVTTTYIRVPCLRSRVNWTYSPTHPHNWERRQNKGSNRDTPPQKRKVHSNKR